MTLDEWKLSCSNLVSVVEHAEVATVAGHSIFVCHPIRGLAEDERKIGMGQRRRFICWQTSLSSKQFSLKIFHCTTNISHDKHYASKMSPMVENFHLHCRHRQYTSLATQNSPIMYPKISNQSPNISHHSPIKFQSFMPKLPIIHLKSTQHSP